MDVKFTVGEFAKLCGMSKQALIFYDKENVINPKFKDPNNGYRYYTPDQLEQMDTIMILREMGLSLSEIKDHMKNRSLDSSLQMLSSQKSIIHRRIKELTSIEKRIDKKVESLHLVEKQNASFEIKDLPERLLAVEKVQGKHGLLDVDIALKKLMKKVKDSNTTHFYQVGDIVPIESLENDTFLSFAWAFVPIDSSCKNIETIKMPKGRYMVGWHVGPYETMGTTYKKMKEKIKKAGREISGPAYEFCILDSLTSSSPDKYCTQILIPIS